jgi:hypothetical protein
MLADANQISQLFSGQGSMWRNPYAAPHPRGAVDTASVWLTAYPLSLITRRNESFLKAIADEQLWKAFAEIGINAIHTGPVKRAGGVSGWRQTPSVDGHFDRISTQLDPAFGTEEEFRQMCATASSYGGTIIDDIVPGHTGKGADFRLAEMTYADYPGIYHMVEINPRDWNHLPDVPAGNGAVNIDTATEEWLDDAGYIIGRLQRVIFYAEGVKETNWSVTRPVVGPDGVTRRWVYLHYFKDGQPSINWLDPSFAGMRLVIGDALHSMTDLGSGGLRLDANGFLGAEKWEQFDQAQKDTETEAAAISDLLRDSAGLPAAVRPGIQQSLIAYTNDVVNDEFPRMRHGEPIEQQSEHLTRVWQSFLQVQPETQSEISFYRESISRLDERGSARKPRISSSQSAIPGELWVLLLGGAVVMLIFTYIFATSDVVLHGVLIALAGALLAFVLYLIFAMEYPFVGSISVSPDPYVHILDAASNLTPK